jgi:hypothetical protein
MDIKKWRKHIHAHNNGIKNYKLRIKSKIIKQKIKIKREEIKHFKLRNKKIDKVLSCFFFLLLLESMIPYCNNSVNDGQYFFGGGAVVPGYST